MNRHVNAISGRLSLRPPQRTSLEILQRITEIAPPGKGTDTAAMLAAIQSEFATVTDFEREFPSLCFTLATGVGKTRLMGAFISYLYLDHGIANFFVLAPNLTIYNKLITDFTPNTAKYVFKGIAEFAVHPPTVVTGDTYESGVGVREAYRQQGSLFPELDGVHINIFNISKINSEVRGGKSPRIKRLSEYIGESYFDYLAGLPDLVMHITLIILILYDLSQGRVPGDGVELARFYSSAGEAYRVPGQQPSPDGSDRLQTPFQNQMEVVGKKCPGVPIYCRAVPSRSRKRWQSWLFPETCRPSIPRHTMLMQG